MRIAIIPLNANRCARCFLRSSTRWVYIYHFNRLFKLQIFFKITRQALGIAVVSSKQQRVFHAIFVPLLSCFPLTYVPSAQHTLSTKETNLGQLKEINGRIGQHCAAITAERDIRILGSLGSSDLRARADTNDVRTHPCHGAIF